ncbi:MAG: nucleotidyl transferase AbiEii/AbiGii toxin family protein [Deltaproteobacteria bacterium]|nr:nucleotidyl transferase AbiEii/AbiGii toxin family protein [Deltaproteobacteria bacterium]
MKILTNLQHSILRAACEIPDRDHFYLAGGTALSAFYLEHRASHDIDMFTGVAELVGPFSHGLQAALVRAGYTTARTRGYDTFVELTVSRSEEGTVVHLAQESPFLLEPPVPATEFPGLMVGSLPDIAAGKLLALFGRAMVRDFIDVYFLTKERFTVQQLCDFAARKDPGFDQYWLGVAMERIETFPDDSPDLHMMVKPCAMADMRAFFKEWRASIAASLAGDPPPSG